MGDDFMSKSSKRTSGYSDFIASPELKQMNRLKSGQATDFFTASPLASFGVERPDLFQPGGGEQTWLNLLQEFGKSPGEYVLNRGGGEADMARNIMSSIIAPEVANRATLMGQGRSGAATEALATAGQKLTADLYPQMISNALMGLQTGREASGVGRMGAQQDFLRRQGLTQGIYSMLPVTTEGRTKMKQKQVEDFTFGDVMQMVMSLVSAVGMAACWVAEALYGPESYDTHCARYWINYGWKGKGAKAGRIAYAILGRPVAALARRSKLVRWALRPLFDKAVRAGKAALGPQEGV